MDILRQAQQPSPKLCACGASFRGRTTLNAHRRTCDAFWQSIYAEMARISTLLYGSPTAISMDEWNTYKLPDFPNQLAMRHWGREWIDLQMASGLGVSSRGRGSLVAKVKLADVKKDPEYRLNEPADTEFYHVDAWPDGLAICEATYQRTGRMMLR